jgi:hypothetical protein
MPSEVRELDRPLAGGAQAQSDRILGWLLAKQGRMCCTQVKEPFSTPCPCHDDTQPTCACADIFQRQQAGRRARRSGLGGGRTPLRHWRASPGTSDPRRSEAAGSTKMYVPIAASSAALTAAQGWLALLSSGVLGVASGTGRCSGTASGAHAPGLSCATT